MLTPIIQTNSPKLIISHTLNSNFLAKLYSSYPNFNLHITAPHFEIVSICDKKVNLSFNPRRAAKSPLHFSILRLEGY